MPLIYVPPACERSERPYFLTGDNLKAARRWLADIEAGKWPERSMTVMAEVKGLRDGSIYTAVEPVALLLPNRVLASRQARILRRIIAESVESQNRWYDRHPVDLEHW